jgi:hypothetical protein
MDSLVGSFIDALIAKVQEEYGECRVSKLRHPYNDPKQYSKMMVVQIETNHGSQAFELWQPNSPKYKDQIFWDYYKEGQFR